MGCEITDITAIINTYHSLNSWRGNSWQRTIFWLMYRKDFANTKRCIFGVVTKLWTENVTLRLTYKDKIYYWVDLNRPWKWLIIIKDLISTKKFKNRDLFPQGWEKYPAPHWLNIFLDCHRKVTFIILKAAEDCCRNKDKTENSRQVSTTLPIASHAKEWNTREEKRLYKRKHFFQNMVSYNAPKTCHFDFL